MLRTILILGALGGGGYALYRYYSNQVKIIEDSTTYKITNVKFQNINEDQAAIDVTALIYNNSNISATVKQIYLNFYINGNVVGNITEIKDTPIAANGSSEVKFRFNFNPKQIFGSLINIVSLTVQTQDLLFKFDGNIKIKKGFIPAIPIPFTYQTTLKQLVSGVPIVSNLIK